MNPSALWLTPLLRLLGRRASRALALLTASFAVLARPGQLRHVRGWLGRAQDRPVTFSVLYRHLVLEARVAFDRVFLLGDDARRADAPEVQSHGDEHLAALARSGRGGLLLGAHLGSVAALLPALAAHGLTTTLVVAQGDAARLGPWIQRLNPTLPVRVLDVAPGSVDFIMTIKQRVADGELVWVLADRAALAQRRVTVDFFGEPAVLPADPWVLAGVLRCPVLLGLAVHSSPDRYDLYWEPLSDRFELPRQAREATIARHAQQYADRLAHHGRLAPLNWFNFFDFWERPA